MKIDYEDKQLIETATDLAKRMMDVCDGAPSRDVVMLAAAGAFVGFARAVGLTQGEALEMVAKGMTAEEIDLASIEGIEQIGAELQAGEALMDRRTLLAGLAMQALIQRRDAKAADIAEEAALYADALIAELGRRGA